MAMFAPPLLLALLVATILPTISSSLISSTALCDFYIKLNGKVGDPHSSLAGWSGCGLGLLGAPQPCGFAGVECDEDGEMTSWDLSFADLTGTIDGGWFFENQASLKKLRTLNLSGNGISGSFPHDLCALSSLVELDLSWNEMSGGIPGKERWGGVLNLERINLSENLFSGELEDDLFLANAVLSHANFAHNARDSLDVDGRGIIHPGFTGALPSSWPASLEVLNFSENSFNRALGTSLCSNNNLVELILNQNFLSGAIDECFMQLSNLRLLHLQQNQFEGELPDFNSFYITEFRVGDNYLTGGLPSSLKNAPLLSILDVSINYLTGDLPASFVSPHLTVIDMRDNNFTSVIPPSYANLNALEILLLSRNSLVGELDPGLFMLPKVREVDVSYNWLTGVIPSNYSESIDIVDLTFNYLNGTLPETISASFREFYFGDNDIVGDVTNAICDLVIAGSLQEVTSCEDLACPAGYHGNDFGAPFQGGCVECLDAVCQPFLAQSTCPEGCQMNWTEVFNAVNDEDSGTGTAGNNGGGNTAALESGGGIGAGVMGAGIGVGICAIVGVGAFVLRRRRMEARFQEVVKMVEDDERGGELRMQRRGDDFNKFKI